MITLALLLSLVPSGRAEYIRNGEFEAAELGPWRIQKWSGECSIRLDSGFVQSGGRSVAFESSARCKIALKQDLGKLPAGSYSLKGYVRAINLRAGRWKRTFLIGLETPQKELFLDNLPAGTYGWKPFERHYKLDQPIDARLYLYLFGPGRIWLDSLRFERNEKSVAGKGVAMGDEKGTLARDIAASKGDVRCPHCRGGHERDVRNCRFCGFDIASARMADEEFKLISSGHEIVGPDLLRNGSFDEKGRGTNCPFVGWAARSMLGGKHSFELAPGRTGMAAKITAGKAGRGDIHNLQDVVIKAGSILRFRFWAKAEKLNGGVSVWFEGDPGEGWHKINVDSSAKDWTLFETRVRVPEGKNGQTKPAIQFWFYNWGTGSILFDDISAAVVRPDPGGAVKDELRRLLRLVREGIGLTDSPPESMKACKDIEAALLDALKDPRNADTKSLKQGALSALSGRQRGDGTFVLGVTHSVEKVFLDEPFQGSIAQSMHITLAQNESEAAQLVVLSADRPLNNVRVSLSGDLKSQETGAAFPSEQVRISLIGYVDTTAGKRPYQSKKLGWWPDPLLPNAAFDVKAGEAQPLLVTVTARGDTKPGPYSGKISVTANSSKIEIPFHVEVLPFALPQRRTYTSFAFGCSPKLVARHYGSDPDQKIMKRFVIKACKRGLPPTDLLNGWAWARPKPPKLAGGGYDFSELDRWIDIFKQHGLSRFPMAIVPRFKKWGGGDYTKKWKTDFADFLRAYADHLKHRGILEKAIIYNIDEAARSKGEWDICKALYKLCKQAVPGVPVVQCLNEPSGVKAISGHANIWDLYYGQYERAGGPDQLKAGSEIILSVCIYPSVHPNLFIEYPLLDARILPWIGFRVGAKGFEYWDMFQWGENIGKRDWVKNGDGTRTAWKLRKPHGDGLLMYPGPDGMPLSSLRLESFRDGLEDYEYLHLLSGISKTDPVAASLVKEAREVIVTGVTGHVKEPSKLLDLRRRIGKKLSER
ncbi:MAG: DUF4091 domain-containing protein [Planctomycetota bacterium]|nr:DUF4091 domain-containing protein [Planctomycetota bacterium]